MHKVESLIAVADSAIGLRHERITESSIEIITIQLNPKTVHLKTSHSMYDDLFTQTTSTKLPAVYPLRLHSALDNGYCWSE